MNTLHRVHVAGALVLIVISVVGYLGGIRPVLADQAQAIVLGTEIQSLESSRGSTHNRLVKVIDDNARLDERIRRQESSFRASSDATTRIQELGQMAERLGMSLVTVNPADGGSVSGFESRILRVVGQDDPRSIHSFLSGLRTTFPDFGIRSMSLQSEADNATFVAEIIWFVSLAEDDGRNDAGR